MPHSALDRRRVDVRRAFSDVGGHVVLGTPKSHQSRTVPLPRFLAAEIASAVAGKHAASLMIQAGYPPKMLQEILGHASITTTLDLYGHLYPGEMDRYADRLNEAAGMSDAADDAAKMRPDDGEDEDDATEPGS